MGGSGAEQVYIRRESADALHCRLRSPVAPCTRSSSWPASSAGVSPGSPTPPAWGRGPPQNAARWSWSGCTGPRPSALRRDWLGARTAQAPAQRLVAAGRRRGCGRPLETWLLRVWGPAGGAVEVASPSGLKWAWLGLTGAVP